MQMEPASLFGDVFARRLEVLGHVEVAHDPRSLAPRAWEVIDPILVGLPKVRPCLWASAMTGWSSP